ncbi:unnamed protein product [Rhizopus stolonifer]
MNHLTLLVLLMACFGMCQADLRSWALGFGKGGSGIGVPAPNSANSQGKVVKTCSVLGKSPHKHTHAQVWFAPECSGSGYWRLQYKTKLGTDCVMFGDVNESGCPFTSFWTSSAQFKAKNRGNGEEYVDKGVTFIGCEKDAYVEALRNEDRQCANDAPASNCKTMLIFSILSFMCPSNG